jgi:hypothetical protein
LEEDDELLLDLWRREKRISDLICGRRGGRSDTATTSLICGQFYRSVADLEGMGNWREMGRWGRSGRTFVEEKGDGDRRERWRCGAEQWR